MQVIAVVTAVVIPVVTRPELWSQVMSCRTPVQINASFTAPSGRVIRPTVWGHMRRRSMVTIAHGAPSWRRKNRGSFFYTPILPRASPLIQRIAKDMQNISSVPVTIDGHRT